MPPLSRWFVKAALLHLGAALLLGVLLASPLAARLGAAAGPLRVATFHLLALGWATQLIVGVAHWMFPPLPGPRERRRGRPAVAAAGFVLLNGGLLARLLAEPMLAAGRSGPWGAVLLGAAGAQLLAAVLLVGHLWPRVRGRG